MVTLLKVFSGRKRNLKFLSVYKVTMDIVISKEAVIVNKSDYEALVKENQALKMEVARLQKREEYLVEVVIKGLEQTIDSLIKENAELKERVAKLEAENTTLRAENATLKADVAELKAENATLKAEIVELKAENSDLRTRLDKRDIKDQRRLIRTALNDVNGKYLFERTTALASVFRALRRRRNDVAHYIDVFTQEDKTNDRYPIDLLIQHIRAFPEEIYKSVPNSAFIEILESIKPATESSAEVIEDTDAWWADD